MENSEHHGRYNAGGLCDSGYKQQRKTKKQARLKKNTLYNAASGVDRDDIVRTARKINGCGNFAQTAALMCRKADISVYW
jgi:hypothetical protein